MSSPGLAYNFRPKMSLPERIISCRSTSRLSVFREKVDSFDFIQNDSVNDESQKQTFFFLLFFILCLLNRYRIDSKSSLSKIKKSSTDKRRNNASYCVALILLETKKSKNLLPPIKERIMLRVALLSSSLETLRPRNDRERLAEKLWPFHAAAFKTAAAARRSDGLRLT